ncbi:MAG: DNA adenine methylase [Armatimonadetes bacterium]|nr:DNA adenine methylase [Armatimonadota bacterium]
MREPRAAPERAEPRPFLKWVGGKRQILDALLRHVPEHYGRYHEPFVGGGALFFALQPERAVLSDENEWLIRTYRGVQRDVEAVITLLQGYPHEREFFESLRQVRIDEGDDVAVAAWLIYLNKTGFNGLYRVNREGWYNVPFGSYRNPTICDAPNLRACAAALAGAELVRRDFMFVLEHAEPGDFVYFDPPYVPLSVTSNFTSYTRDGFTHHDQQRLRDVALELKSRGVKVLLSNSSAPLVQRLYADGFEVEEVSATRLINSKASGRGRIPELIIW